MVAASGWRSRPSQVVDVAVAVAVELDVDVDFDGDVGACHDVHGRWWQQVDSSQDGLRLAIKMLTLLLMLLLVMISTKDVLISDVHSDVFWYRVC